MPDLDKWQKREAEQYARDNDVSYEDAVAALFPDEPTKAPAGDPVELEDKAPAAKVSTSKAPAK